MSAKSPPGTRRPSARTANDGVPAPPVVPVLELPAYIASTPLQLDDGGAPRAPLVFVDLDAAPGSHADLAAAQDAAARCQRVLVGVAYTDPDPRLKGFVEALTCTVTAERWDSWPAGVQVPDLVMACSDIASLVHGAPRAALVLGGLLRMVARMPVADGLVAESLAYSMLLAGPEFAQWRARVPRAASYQDAEHAVLVRRQADTLHLVLNRPQRHNAFARDVRDGLADALDAALLDEAVKVRLSGKGPSFCSGGDLDEFGLAPDPVIAHLVRLERSVALRLNRCKNRVEAFVHGACIGAGVEIAAFARQVVATDDTQFELPELAMGLIPGAGGTVSLSARIGRWRTAFLALSGQHIGADTALAWGLVDQVRDWRRHRVD